MITDKHQEMDLPTQVYPEEEEENEFEEEDEDNHEKMEKMEKEAAELEQQQQVQQIVTDYCHAGVNFIKIFIFNGIQTSHVISTSQHLIYKLQIIR